MSAIGMIAPLQWQPVAAALAAAGHEVYWLLGRRMSENLHGIAQQVDRETTDFRIMLDAASGPALVNLHKTGRAVGALDVLVNEIGAFGGHLVTAYGVRRIVEKLVHQKDIAAFVVTCTSDVPGRAVVVGASGIPVVHLQHACMSDPPEDAWYTAEHPGDLVLVPGERDQQWWQRCNPKARVLVTGHPLWDTYARLDWGRPEKATILWADQSPTNQAQTPAYWWSRNVPERAWHAFLDALGRISRPFDVVLKFRDGEMPDYVRARVQAATEARDRSGGHYEIVVSVEPPPVALARASVVVCQDSNSGVEALHLSIPVLSITRRGSTLFRPPVWTFDGNDADLTSWLANAIALALSWAGTVDLRAEAAYYNRGAVDGQSTDRVCDAIGRVAAHGVEAVGASTS